MTSSCRLWGSLDWLGFPVLLLLVIVVASGRTADAFSPSSSSSASPPVERGPPSPLRGDTGSDAVDVTTAADVIICGGGPTGLLAAIMLAQKFPKHNIQLFERELTPPPLPDDDKFWIDESDRHYLIGLGGRGITSLERFGVWDDVARVATAVPGRRDWTTSTTKAGKKGNSSNNKVDNDSDNDDDDIGGVETIQTGRKYTTHVLSRDRLVSVLHHHIVSCQRGGSDSEESVKDGRSRAKYDNVFLNYGYRVEPERIALTDEKVTSEEEAVMMVRSRQVVVRVETTTTTTISTPADGDGNDAGDEEPSSPAPSQNLFASADLVIAADGSARAFANEMERLDLVAAASGGTDPINRFMVVRYPDDNQRVYKNIPFRIPGGWRRDMNYAVRTNRIIFDALPANDQGDYVGVLLMRVDDAMARPDVDQQTFRDFLNDEVPQFVDHIDDETIRRVAKRPPSTLPKFRYVRPRLHHEGKTLLLGDCAHTVKPYFGMGANSALEDVKVFSDCIDANDGDLVRAVYNFSSLRSPEIEVLVQTSHRLDSPGLDGVFNFLIPIILDGIFSKLAPQWFAPNIIAMLQNEEVTFSQAVERKQRDRLGQLAIVAGSVGLLGQIVNLVHF